METKDIRTLGFFGHAGHGKTSICDAILFAAGAASRLGRVDNGTSALDYNVDEVERKISISAKPISFEYKGKRLHMVDTPGYQDFAGEVIGTLRAIDSAIIVLDATTGPLVGTERAWDSLNEKGISARMVFVNKLDKENADFVNAVDSLQQTFGKALTPVQFPIGTAASFKGAVSLLDAGELSKLTGGEKEEAESLYQELAEKAAECDDSVLEKYLGGTELSADEVKSCVRRGVISGKIVPVLCGCASNDSTIKALLDCIIEYMPSPMDMPEVKGIEPKSKQPLSRKNSDVEPFSAFVFKTIADPYVGQLSIFRVFSGMLKSDTSFYNSTKDLKERIGPVYFLKGKEQAAVTEIKAGDVAAVAKLKDTQTGDTMCDEKNLVLFDKITFPEPAMSASVKPHSKSDEEKIMTALHKLAAEDPTFTAARDAETKELLISGSGDMHLDVMVNRLRKRFGVQVDIGTPKVPHRETVHAKARVQGKYKRQSGGRGQYGDVWLEIEPLQRGGGFEFVDKIVGGAIPRNYIPSVEKGVREAMQHGILSGCPVVDVRVTLCDGSFHPVDSSDMAFQIAGSMAFKKAQEDAKPVLLEPVMEVEVSVPSEYMGAVTGDLNSKRGRIIGMDTNGKLEVVKANVPLAELFKYASELRSMTGGRGYFTMKYSRYEEVPAKIAAQVVAQHAATKETAKVEH